MNKAELKAMLIIAKKMNWQNKSVNEVIETVKQMVRNQQALELDTVGECDSDEDTLLTIAFQDREEITSTMYVSDYSLWNRWNCFINSGCEGITFEDFCTQLVWANIKDVKLAIENEIQEANNDYYVETMRDIVWMAKHC